MPTQSFIRSLAAASTLLIAAGCTGPPPEVVIQTHVAGELPAAQREQLDAWKAVLARAGDGWRRRSPGSSAAPESDAADSEASPTPPAERAPPPVYDPKPPQDSASFHALVRALREGPVDELDVLARNLAESSPELWPELSAILLAARERPKREYKQVLALIGGDVPNRYGHFALHWKKAHGHDVRVSEDWFEDLLALEPGRISKLLRPVYRDAILTTALLRAAPHAAAAEPELVEQITRDLLDVAYVHDGTFRDEVGRAIDGLGDPAIAPLLRESLEPEDAEEGSTAERRAAYARFSLDRMDRLHPSRALEAVASDRRMLASVLEAYGLVREGEAAQLLLDHVDSDAPLVRARAREAFAAYVTGPLPKVRRKSIRLLNGQTSTQRAELSYREHARLAIRERLAETAPGLLEEECELWLEGGVIDSECERQPERLYQRYLELLDARRASERLARVARALSDEDPVAGAALLDTLLSDPGAPLDAKLIAPFYAEVARLVAAEGQTQRSAQLLRKSAMLLAELDPDAARALTVDALMAEAATEGLDERGRQMLLATARELDPDSQSVAAALAKLEVRAHSSTRAQRDRLATFLLALLASLALLAWASSRVHRRLALARA